MTDKLADWLYRWRESLRCEAPCQAAVCICAEKTDQIIAALRREPEPVPEGFVRAVPDPQMRTIIGFGVVNPALARQLERELIEAQARIAELEKDTARLDWWGGGIREAIDRAMASGAAPRPSTDAALKDRA